MSVTLDSLNVNFSRFVIYSKPAILFIPSPEYMVDVLIFNKSSFVIGSFIFFLSKLYLLICCCNFLSTITFATFSCCSTLSSLFSFFFSGTLFSKFKVFTSNCT